MKTFIIFSLLGDHSKTEKELEKAISKPEPFLSKLDITELRNLVLHTSAENARLEKEVKALKEENEKVTEIASRTSVALAELKQGVLDAVDVSEAYFGSDNVQ